MGFDPQPFFEASLAIQIHALSAVIAFFLGAVVFLRKKGSPRHRAMGKIWVGLMLIVALSSFFIHEIRTWGLFSPIHLISVFTLGSLGYAIWSVRRRNIIAHQYTMIGLYAGGLVFAGALTFARDLMMHRIFIASSDSSAWPSFSELPGGILFPIAGAGLIFLAIFWVASRSTAASD